MTGIFMLSNGQSEINSGINGQLTQIPLVFDQQEFGDKFSVLFYSDDEYDYYAIDLTKLEDNFEKVYFMNLSYGDARVVNLDGDIEKDQTFFKAYFNYKEDEVTCLFGELKEKTEEISFGMTAEDKSAWMAKYNKFNKGSNHD
jgi:phytoene dehydrogenase-like protein